jgi:serine/threonine-protein kinase
MIFGTPEYMSPEQAAGKPLDHRVDVYALGVILFEMITGRVPFVGDTFMGILTQHMFEQVPGLRVVNPHVQCPEDLEVVIFHALSKDPQQRYGSMGDLAKALVAAMDLSGAFKVDTFVGYGVPATPLAGPRLGSRSDDKSTVVDVATRKSRAPVVLGLASVVLVGGAIGAYFALQPSSTSQALTPEVPIPVGTEPAAELSPTPTTGDDPVPSEPETEDEGIVATPPTAGGTAMVSVEVRTQPEGARVMVGDETVCEPSPCRFDTEAGRSIRIQVQRGVYFATRDLEPTETMSIEMPMTRRTRRRNPNEQAGTGTPRMTMSNDLKVPDIFRD